MSEYDFHIATKPEFQFKLSLSMIMKLTNMAESHYDSTCKAAGRVGGFIYGWKNHVSFDSDAVHSATFRQLDLVLKICENVAYLDKKHERDEVYAFTHAVRQALQSDFTSKIRISVEALQTHAFNYSLIAK